MKKSYKILIYIVLFFTTLIVITFFGALYNFFQEKPEAISQTEPSFSVVKEVPPPKISIPKISSNTDYNNDGVPDSEDILIGARIDAKNKPTYISEYYDGGYPPDNEGVCTDVIWRALKQAGYNLKDLVDADIASNVSRLSKSGGKTR